MSRPLSPQFSDTYGTENWGESSLDVSLSGLSLTSALGTPTISTEINTGWGQDGWGVENWGQSGLTVELTAPNELKSPPQVTPTSPTSEEPPQP